MSSNVADLGEVFKQAHDEGDLSLQSMQALNSIDLGAQIQAGLGISADDVEASEVVLVTMMPDDSGSIQFAGNKQAVIDGHNLVLDALKKSKQTDAVLAHTRYLNGDVLFPYRKLEDAEVMTPQNYDPRKGTPLYDQTIALLGTVMAKHREFADSGVPARTITLIVTDGADQHSSSSALDVKPLVEDMLRQECHIIAAMGIKDDAGADFKRIFQQMGVQDEWILTPGNSETEVRKAFQVFSQSAVRASQGGASFSQTAMGGFGS